MRIVQIRKVPFLAYLTEFVIGIIVLSSSSLQIGASGGEFLMAERQLGNLTLGDIAVVVLGGVLLMQTSSRNELLRFFFERGYGILALFGTVALLGAAAMADDKNYQLKQASQFLFVVWVLIPVIAVGISMADSFQGVVRRQAYFFSLVFTVGALLYFGLGNTSVLRIYGDNRIFSNMLFDNCGFIAMAYVIERLINGAGKKEIVGVWLTAVCILVWVTLSSSRTGFVMLCALMAMQFAGRFSRISFAGIFGALAAGGLVFLSYRLLFETETDLMLTRSDGFRDGERLALIEYGLRSLGGDLFKILFGTGWDSSGIHNFMIQSLVDSGVLVAIFFSALVAIPIVLASRHAPHGRETSLIRGMALAFFIQLSLNAMPTLRALWIALAVAFGGMLWSATTRAIKTRTRP
jgi:hypothetical protein